MRMEAGRQRRLRTNSTTAKAETKLWNAKKQAQRLTSRNIDLSPRGPPVRQSHSQNGARAQGFASPRPARPCPLRAILHRIKIATGGSGGNSNHSRYGIFQKGRASGPLWLWNSRSFLKFSRHPSQAAVPTVDLEALARAGWGWFARGFS